MTRWLLFSAASIFCLMAAVSAKAAEIIMSFSGTMASEYDPSPRQFNGFFKYDTAQLPIHPLLYPNNYPVLDAYAFVDGFQSFQYSSGYSGIYVDDTLSNDRIIFRVNGSDLHLYLEDYTGTSIVHGSLPSSLGIFQANVYLSDFRSVGEVKVDFSSTSGVPEPATWATMLLGLGLIGGTMRARRGKTAIRVYSA